MRSRNSVSGEPLLLITVRSRLGEAWPTKAFQTDEIISVHPSLDETPLPIDERSWREFIISLIVI
jgi:hypothetical protein